MSGTGLESKRLLIVSSCSASKQFAYKRLYELGVELIVMNGQKAEWLEPYVKEWILCDIYDHDGALQALQTYLNEWNTIDWAMTFREESVLLTSKITDTLWLIGIPHDIASLLKDKHTFKQMFGSPIYNKSIKLHEAEDIKQLTTELWYPIVMKPAFGADSSLVIKVSNEQEALDTFNFIQSRIQFDEYTKDGKDIVAEKYMDGCEVDIDILMQDKKIIYHTITDNDPTNEPYFIELGQSVPSRHADNVQKELIASAENTLIKSGVTDGLFHMEAKYTSDTGAEILEANLRLGGFTSPCFSKNTWGVDLVENAAKIALWVPCTINKAIQPLSYEICKFIIPAHAGTITNIYIPETVQKEAIELRIIKKIGQKVKLPPEGFDYIGWIAFQGSSFEEAQDKMDTMLPQIQVDLA